jgi:hypothetical protein
MSVWLILILGYWQDPVWFSFIPPPSSSLNCPFIKPTLNYPNLSVNLFPMGILLATDG